MKAIVDTERCIASGRCALEVPEVFDQREQDGIVRLVTPQPAFDDALRDRVREVVRMCPARAIVFEDERD